MIAAFASYVGQQAPQLEALTLTDLLAQHTRTSTYLQHRVFNTYHSETQMMRYLFSLQKKDLGLNTVRPQPWLVEASIFPFNGDTRHYHHRPDSGM